MPSNHLIFCRHLLLPPSIFPSIRVFSNESVLHIRWAKYCTFSFNISPSNEYSGLMSFRMDWLDLLFQSCGHCWVFQICWHIECSTFTASSFRIWNSSARIPSPPLALFIVKLSKAHLTSHSRRSGSRWVITPLWLSGSLRSFLYSSFVYSWHLFLISFASVRSFLAVSVLYCAHPCMKFPLVSPNILEEISSLFHSIVFLYFIALFIEGGLLSPLAILWNSEFSWLYLSLSLFAFCFSFFLSYL